MHRGIAERVIIRIDADIEGARRKIDALKKEADTGPTVRTERPTGENYEAPWLKIAGGALGVAGGAAALFSPELATKTIGGLVMLGGSGLALTAELIEQMEKLDIKTRRLNDILEAYQANLKTIAEMAQKADGPDVIDGDAVDKGEFSKVQKLARSKNSAIVSGLAETWERLALVWGRMQRSGGASVYPERAQEILDDIQAVERALADISVIDNRSGAEDALSRVRKFLTRSALAAPPAPPEPSVPFFGEGGEPQGGGRVFPRTPPAPFFGEGGEPRFLGPSPRRGSSPWDFQMVSLGTSDANPILEYMEQIAEKAKVATQEFASLGDQVDTFDELTGNMATRIADANVLFAGQADVLTTVGGLLPDIGQRITDLFDTGIEGAEDLDRAVAAMGERFLDAFEGAILRGESLSDVLKSLGRDLAELALNEVKTNGLGGIFDILGGLFTSAVLPAAGGQSGPHKGAKGLVFTNARLDGFAKGGAFDMGARIEKFANGSAFLNTVVNRPTLFPMANGTGLMGEAGPEAVLPLTRLPNGDLGVSMPGAPAAAAAGGAVNITINAPGASLEGLRIVAAEVRELRAYAIQVSNSIEPRAVGAINWHRSRRPW